MAASLVASGRFPPTRPQVAPGVPGGADASREALLRRLATSQRIIERAARSIAGHEMEPCPLTTRSSAGCAAASGCCSPGSTTRCTSSSSRTWRSAWRERGSRSCRVLGVPRRRVRRGDPAHPARSASHLPGLWQCVTGGIEPGERVPDAALREVREETGLDTADIEAFTTSTRWRRSTTRARRGGGVRDLRPAGARRCGSASSHEHDAMRWVSAADVPAAVVWPSYAESVRRVAEVLTDPEREPWFRLDAEGRRIARRPLAE
ncbi:MAG: NUDIX domain-containing protein [Chloroflexota bacterium]